MTQPKARKDHIGVGVGALIFNDEGHLLLTLRGEKAKNERGKWEIPGGAVEFGETIEQALKREIKEELDIEIEVTEMLQLCDHIIPDEDQHWVSPTYICKIIDGEPRNLEPGKCDEIGWFSLEDAEKLPLSIVTKHDIAILKKREHQENIGCAVIVQDRDGKVLLGKRKNAYRSGMYGLPGGRIDRDEKAIAAAKRELLEETGLKAKSLEYVGVIKEWQDSYNFIHFMYLCNDWEGNVQLVEPEKCESWEWFDLDNLPEDVLPGHFQGIELLISESGMIDV
ncbi:NUDIX domain-containing protein [Candidatus Woesebacteria bacterium]|nr:NUDIX domain-containing protein [Candidatus Woesebacteria bacterium]MCD8545832.1 NUDIX domain-containing protein [Candidatus Woesebacteria bacterium]